MWRLPLAAAYDKLIDSRNADMKNIAGKPVAGSIVGAQFVKRFIKDGLPWAHLDIASVAWSGPNDWKPAGSAGFSMRLLEHFVRNYQPVPRGEGENN